LTLDVALLAVLKGPLPALQSGSTRDEFHCCMLCKVARLSGTRQPARHGISCSTQLANAGTTTGFRGIGSGRDMTLLGGKNLLLTVDAVDPVLTGCKQI